ncbi:MAG: hypothetical protein E7055_06560 [Lentisphaerae bacterium]|nr:hypothetical protein [Lentisphaerota bacterium]
MRYLYLTALVLLFACSCRTESEKKAEPSGKERILYQTRFLNGPAGWTSEGNCDWSLTARVPGKTGSISVRRMNDTDADNTTRWLSPAIDIGGKRVKVSFFAADNYLVQQDFSYSAHVKIQSCSPDGTKGQDLKTVYTEWDNSVVSPYMWGRRTRENLIWRYYETDVPAGSRHIRIEFGFRGPLVRGSCYLTDLTVMEADEPGSVQTEKKGKGSAFLLELSNPAVGGLFYQKDTLRFDASIRGDLPKNAELAVTVTDFEYNVLGSFRYALEDASVCTIPGFYESAVARARDLTRANHRVKRFILTDSRVREPGILYRIKADLTADGKKLASDTSLYGVVHDPTPIPAEKMVKSWFWTRNIPVGYFDGGCSAGKSPSDQNMPRKSGSLRTCELSESYNWRQLQPQYPGPVIIKKKLDRYPVQTYMPNIEQVHISRFIPEGAQKKKPVRTFYAGRRDMPEVDYDADAYADFILEYIRQNRDAIDWVIPSGLERGLSERVLILQKKVYEECHRRFPEIKVGFCINFITTEQFDKHELWRWADFLNLHMYGATAGFPIAGCVTPYQNYYRSKFKRSAPPFTLTEGALRMPPGHTNYAAGTMRGIWSLLEQNFQGIYYYHQGNTNALKNPDTTDVRTPDPGSSVYDNYRYHQLAARPIMAPELVMLPNYKGRRWDDRLSQGGGVSILPTVSTLTYINLIRDFDNKKIRFSRVLPSVKIYCFDGENTVCGLDPREGSAGNPIEVRCTEPYILQDIYGRRIRITPVNGRSVIQTGEYPSTLIFPVRVKNLSFTEMKCGGLQKMSGISGNETTCKIDLGSGVPTNGDLLIGGQDKVFGTAGKIDLPAIPAGEYPVRVLLKNQNEVWGFLRSKLKIEDPLFCRLTPVPGDKPGLKVVLKNRSGQTTGGKIRFRNEYLPVSPLPEVSETAFAVKSGESREIFLPIDRSMAKSTYNEFVTVKVELNSGTEIRLKERLHFRGIAHAENAPVIDGDLADWPLDKLQPTLLERVRMTNPAEPSPDEMTSRGKFYTMWKDRTLYMAAVIEDATPISRHQDVGLWIDDNLLLGIYPWRHFNGEKYNPGYYRGHIGLHKDGTSGNYREPDVPPGGSVSTSQIKTAIKRSGGRIIYELAFPGGTLYPFLPGPEQGLRISLTCFDASGIDNRDFGGMLSYFGGANVNYHMDVNQWLEFICMK